MKKAIPLLIILSVLLNACTIFKKDISRPVTVYYNESDIIASISSSAYHTKYVDYVSTSEVTANFLEHFTREGRNTRNVTLTTDSYNADYILKFKSLNLTETSKTEKISDSKSQYYGQDVVLNSVECYVAFELQDTKNPGRRFMICSNSKSRSEKFTNNRDLGDLITGSNKDKSEYRTKLLSDGIAIQLAQDVGRRVWVPITRRIAKSLK